jgi:glucokinase
MSSEKNYDSLVLLAGDVGGTKTLLGIFEPGADRPRPIDTGEFVTLDYDGLESMVLEFLRAQRISPLQIDSACFGVAGAVTDQVARLTNVPWLVDAANVAGRVGMRRVWILNDLEALGYGVTVLTPDELAVLQHGVAVAGGNAAVIAAGTGLGQGLLHNIDGEFIPGASEGGHADFAARTPRELEMVAALTALFGRVSVEHVVSGPGIVNIYQFTHAAIGTGPLITPSMAAPARLCAAVDGHNVDYSELPARITQAALKSACPKCVETLAMFVSAYGSEAGNLALRTVATAGVYVGGGIAPKILPALEEGAFLDAFRSKEPMTDLVATIPVSVILNEDAGLIGAAVYAQTIVDRNAR